MKLARTPKFQTHAAPLLLVATTFLLLAANAFAADWPQWRGPNRDGISTEKAWLSHWPDEGPRTLWKMNVGAGYSCPAIVKGQLFTMGFFADKRPRIPTTSPWDAKGAGMETIWRLNAATGAVIWKYAYPAFGSETYSTPTVYDGRVYALGGFGQLSCLDADSGAVIWKKDLIKDFAGTSPFYGYSCSPLVIGEVLIVECGGKEASYFGLDRKTGQTVWKWGNGEAGFSSPVAYDAGGRRGVVLVTPSILLGVNPDTGKELWRYEGHRKGAMNTCATPIVQGDEVFLLGSWNGRLAVVLKLPPLTTTEPKVVWENKDMLNFFESSVLIDGYIFGVHSIDHNSRNCSLRCVRFDTGKIVWDQPDFGHAALTAADGKLIILSEHGELTVVEATSAGFKQLARAQVLGGQTWVCPVLCDGRIYCRNNVGDLICLDVKKQ